MGVRCPYRWLARFPSDLDRIVSLPAVQRCGKAARFSRPSASMARRASTLAKEEYAARAVDIPACSVNAPHIRNRLYWVADCAGSRSGTGLRETDAIFDGDGPGGSRRRAGRLPDADRARLPSPEQRGIAGAAECAVEARAAASDPCRDFSRWDEWVLIGPDQKGKYRRVKPGIRLLAHGIPARIPKLRAFGNAIVPWLAAEVIRAYMETGFQPSPSRGPDGTSASKR